MKTTTLCYPMRQNELLMGYKKVGFGAGKLVGYGGKVQAGETVLQTAVRELHEESSLHTNEADLIPMAQLTFYFPAKPEWDLVVHGFFVPTWQGQLQESREIRPIWMPLHAIPYEQMWDDAQHWLPHVLAGEYVTAQFTFQEDNDTLATWQISPSENLPLQSLIKKFINQ